MSRRERDKGKRGEREAARKLRQLGIDGVRRGRQYAGRPDAADVVGTGALHLEIKRTERLSIYAALEQAAADAGADQAPVLLHRRNRKPWIVALYLDDWAAVSAELLRLRAQNGED